ncbi:MAG: His/Gly/Thr/Pro-type tRNA ligase C-terminal domain-containing protein [Deinococcales bacterium]
MLGYLFSKSLLKANKKSPTLVLISLPDEASRPRAFTIAAALRSRGIPCDIHAKPDKYGKQIRAAERRGIPYIWFFDSKDEGKHEIKDIRSGEQFAADLETWMPPFLDSEMRVEVVKP